MVRRVEGPKDSESWPRHDVRPHGVPCGRFDGRLPACVEPVVLGIQCWDMVERRRKNQLVDERRSDDYAA
jgi:hypothetical protein